MSTDAITKENVSFEPCYCERCKGRYPAPCRYGAGVAGKSDYERMADLIMQTPGCTKEKIMPVHCPGCGTAVVPDTKGRMPSHTIGVNAPCNLAGHTVKSATAVLRFNATYDANARRRGQYDER